MIPHAHQQRVSDAEAWMLEAFGTTHSAYLRKTRMDAMNIYVDETLRILTNARVRDLIKQWRRESGHHSPRGRKQTIDEHAALGVMLIQMRVDGDLRFNNMAETIVGLSDSQRESLGIRSHDVEEAFWYDRLWRAVARLQRLVDPHPGNRHKLPRPRGVQTNPRSARPGRVRTQDRATFRALQRLARWFRSADAT